jgi:citrate synthase
MSITEVPPGLADVPVAKSAISIIDGKKAILAYRGIPVEVLAKESHFEEVSYLLLHGELPTQRQLAHFSDELKSRRSVKFKVKDLLKALPETTHPMVALQTVIASLGGFYPAKSVSDSASNWEATYRILASMPTVVAAFYRISHGLEPIEPHADLDHAGNFFYMMFGKEPSPSVRKVLDACLILHAEHNMNASTFSARVTSSTLSSPYATISAAVGTLSGPLHGGANEEVLEMLNEIGPVANVKPWLDKKRAENASFKVMGFGHRVYKVKDPRATVLQEFAEQAFAESGRPAKYEVAMTLEKACESIFGVKGVYPNVDFYSGVIYEALGIPMEQFTPIFAIARAAGWLSHWHEQLQNNRIYRPEQIYVGKTEAPYIPLDQRP